MTDIVEQLRALAHDYHQHRPHYEKAADEIEKLRTLLKEVYELSPFHAADCEGRVEYKEGALFDNRVGCTCFLSRIKTVLGAKPWGVTMFYNRQTKAQIIEIASEQNQRLVMALWEIEKLQTEVQRLRGELLRVIRRDGYDVRFIRTVLGAEP